MTFDPTEFGAIPVESTFDPSKFGAIPVTSEMPEKKTIGGFLGNTVKSGANFIGGVGEAVLHPIQTVKNIGKVALGGVEKLGGQENQNTDSFDSLTSFFKDRYGSLDSLKNTIYTDPVGFAADVSTVFTGAGGALGTLGKAAEISKFADTANVIGKVATASKTAASFTDPLRIAGKVGGALATKTLGGIDETAQGIYHSALKPTKSLITKFPNVVKTGLEKGVVVSEEGLHQVGDAIEELNSKISDDILTSTQKGNLVLTPDVTNRITELKDFFQENDALPQSKIEALSKIEKEFLDAQDIAITPAKAQQLKIGLYKELKNSYGEFKNAEREGRKALARGLKEEIAKKIPELNKLNAAEGELIGLEDALETFVNRQANHQFIGLGDTTSAIAGAAAFGKKGLLVGLVNKALDNPNIKSRLAIALNKISKGTGKSGRTANLIKSVARKVTPASNVSGASSER